MRQSDHSRDLQRLCCCLLLFAAASATSNAEALPPDGRPFPIDVPTRTWTEFAARGFERPVCGVIYDGSHGPCCGVPLGGIGTGCLDVDPTGTFGFCSIFNGYPRQRKLFHPFLGLSVGSEVHVLADANVIAGGLMESCVEKGRDPYYPERQADESFWHKIRPATKGVKAPKRIRYWGHYPVVDVDYELDGPVQASLRAWSPFLPGDVAASDTPAAIFEVRIANESDQPQSGTLAMSFDGPLVDALPAKKSDDATYVGAPPVFTRRPLTGGVNGVAVLLQSASYALGVIDADQNQTVKTGGALDHATWQKLGQSLPAASDAASGSSASVEYSLQPGESRTVRFLLAWHAPTWGSRKARWHRMSVLVYPTVDDVVRFMAERHDSLLPRILNWQSVIYASRQYPIWLRDSLINNLALITEDGYYAQPTGPIAEWCPPEGLFGMIEAPRVCPQIECIPCSWYGNMPIVYFFPQLARTTLVGYREYMREDGAAPFCFGPKAEMWQENNNHAHNNQIMLNGVCFVDLVYRMWQRTGDDKLLAEFYDAVKRSTTLTATMGEPPHRVVGFPPGDAQTEWWEGWPWTGIATHAAGMHLSNLLLAEQMAIAMKDDAFASQCRAWFEEGSLDVETHNWRDGSYLLFSKPRTGQQSDKIMANQLDAEWANAYLGLPSGVFKPERVASALETIRRTCLNPIVGAVSFASRDGEQELTTYGIFPPETLILGMTYLYLADRATGLEICRQCMDNLVLRQGKPWDMPNMVHADTGEVRFGTDYYQMMIVWAVPAAIDGQGLAEFCQKGGLVDRILEAAQDPGAAAP